MKNTATSTAHLNAPTQVLGVVKPEYERILTPGALNFLADLHRQFSFTRKNLLNHRNERQRRIDEGEFPVLSVTRLANEREWIIDPIPDCLQNRRVEITGPVDRKMIINALNSGANVFMADFEDSNAPTWENIMEGQMNLFDAVRNTISFESNDGKQYTLNDEVAVLKIRPRGWHLEEKNILIDGEPASASLVDFALFMYHNGKYLAEQKRGPFFYLPKLENHFEARLWNNIFCAAEDWLALAPGTIKATVLIETITAALEMEDIIFELREHMAGLNAGRWDYIFSIIKKFRNHPQFVMPDRAMVTMEVPFMKAYAEQLVKICHKRGAHAIGGMSAFIPSKDEEVNKKALEKVKADKTREASQGYDGTWVAHPKLVGVAKQVFDHTLKDKPHQKEVMRDDITVTAVELLNVASAGNTITENGFRTNINVALLYLESWLQGVGAVALYNLMEDAATAEISRAQLWQWIKIKARLKDGRTITSRLYSETCDQEFEKILEDFPKIKERPEHLLKARTILDGLVLNNHFEEFLTTIAYQYI